MSVTAATVAKKVGAFLVSEPKIFKEEEKAKLQFVEDTMYGIEDAMMNSKTEEPGPVQSM